MLRVLHATVWCGTVIALVACGKGGDDKQPAPKSSSGITKRKAALSIPESTTQTRDTCPPLTVTLDGKPLSLTYGVSKTVFGTPSIGLYEAPVTCEAFMNAESSTYKVAHVAVGIGITKKGRVSVGASRGGTAHVNRVSAPAKVGDTMALCIPTAVEFEPLHASMKGRLRVQGLVEGKHCGDVKKTE